MAHEGSGHLGAQKVKALLKQRFIWPGMGLDVIAHTLRNLGVALVSTMILALNPLAVPKSEPNSLLYLSNNSLKVALCNQKMLYQFSFIFSSQFLPNKLGPSPETTSRGMKILGHRTSLVHLLYLVQRLTHQSMCIVESLSPSAACLTSDCDTFLLTPRSKRLLCQTPSVWTLLPPRCPLYTASSSWRS